MQIVRATFLSILLLTTPLLAQDRWDALRDVIRAEMNERRIPGAAIAVIAEGEVVFAEGFGVAGLERQRHVTTDTRFRIGSVAKMFTAATIVSMARGPEPVLALDTPIRTYLPSLPPRLGALTLDQLLTHRAGVVDRLTPRALDETDLFLEPGTFSYSSLGYALAGRVAAAAAGKPFELLVEERLFRPLGMTSTSYAFVPASDATGYELKNDKARRVPFMDPAHYRPAGFLGSSVNDLSRYAIAFMNDGLPGNVTAELSQPRANVPADPRQYGYGTMLVDESDESLVFHGGDEPGGSAFLKMAPARKCAVIVTMNLMGRLEKTMAKALELAAGVPAPPKQEEKHVALAREDAREIAGTYMNHYGFRLVRKGDSAILKPWLPWFRWLPMRRELVKFGPDQFGIVGTTLSRDPVRFTILRDPDGRIEGMFFMGRLYKRV